MSYLVRCLADSISEHEQRLTTFHFRYPRAAVHEDVLTHRDFSRNASSSRAMPVAAMLRRADWEPERWGRNRKGMGATEALDAESTVKAQDAWRWARQICQEAALELAELGVAKEDANLLLRPFEYIDVVITATRWTNFLSQRSDETTGLVRRQVKQTADEVKDYLGTASPVYLQPGQWHLPFVSLEELSRVCEDPALRLTAARASAMRCARTTHARFDGTEGTLENDATACDERLVHPGHWSPLEHPCKALAEEDCSLANSNVDGWKQLRKHYDQEYAA